MNGFAQDSAENMSAIERAARLVIIGEANGGEFDFKNMKWKDRS